MLVRKPNIAPENSDPMWSKIPEFCITFNGGSPTIPLVESYLNNVILEIKNNHCSKHPVLEHTLDIFIQQETFHTVLHRKFNSCLLDVENEKELRAVEAIARADFKRLRQKCSLAYNAAFCCGFENLATLAAKYLFEECDELFAGSEAHGANLLIWHVAEEFEHRAVCHDALHVVSKSYFLRMRGLFRALFNITGYFVKGEAILLKHYRASLTVAEIKESKRQTARLHKRLILWAIPKIIKVMVPGYHPNSLKIPEKVPRALRFFQSEQAIETLFDFSLNE